jgi:aminoglycoside phosphotransferase (APT) family kinase protein
VPRTLGLCEDPSVIGTPFFVMAHVEGRIFWNVQMPEVTSATERGALWDEIVRVLAAIHTVDVDAVGLSDYGKKGQYVARQVERWSRQYRASQTEIVAPMEALLAYLPAHVPASDATTLVHGDFRPDNLVFHPTEPRIVAVLDWELSTLGHPLSDLAYLCMLYDVALPKVGGLLGVDFEATGIPTEAALLAAYGRRTGLGERPDDWAYFKAFGLFRLAAIAQGVYQRSLQGNASSDEAAMYGAAVGHLAQIACGLLEL